MKQDILENVSNFVDDDLSSGNLDKIICTVFERSTLAIRAYPIDSLIV